MIKNRIIPVILLKNGRVVQSKEFKRHQVLGNPTSIMWRLSNWFADEVIYLDISRESYYDLKRDDLNYKNTHNIIDIIKEVSGKCFMPLTVGGKIRSIEDIYERLNAGADKVSINTQAHKDDYFIGRCAKEFGSQCIVGSIDYRKVSIDYKKVENRYEVFINCGRDSIGISPSLWAKELERRGCGEIILNSIDRDGIGNGYDIEVIEEIVNRVNIPVIALGGAGNWNHFGEVLEKTNVSAVAASNIFQYTENSYYKCKQYLYKEGFHVRSPMIKTIIGDNGI